LEEFLLIYWETVENMYDMISEMVSSWSFFLLNQLTVLAIRWNDGDNLSSLDIFAGKR
jgi:hypothetical protein